MCDFSLRGGPGAFPRLFAGGGEVPRGGEEEPARAGGVAPGGEGGTAGMGGVGEGDGGEGDGGAGLSRGGLQRLLMRLAERKLARDAAAGAGRGAGEGASTSVYAGKEYWDARYREAEAGSEGGDGRDEWYAGFDSLQVPLKRAIPSGASALVVGCGLSGLTEDLATRGGCSRVVGCDISEECVARMRALRAERGAETSSVSVAFDVADCRALPYADGEFDAVVDKGTLDTMMQADDPGPAREMLAEASRVLRPGGVFFSVSYGDEEMRVSELERPGLPWVRLFADTLAVGRTSYYIYAYTKPEKGASSP